ncbi:hypothetical protein [Lunatibacter salilacus]|uniref:hypothetical protein n=1 Tax=Lunatibacter salilacus TaxID=2483804 RepID=UPI00131A9744|nr:hypothetical protein [Lunatibacter salilacus]
MEHKITICTEDPQLIDQITNLIKDEKATYLLEQSSNNSSEKLVEIMNQLAASTPIKSIKDPLLWQKDVRKDKKLLGRD